MGEKNEKKLRALLLSTNSDEAGAPIHVQTLVTSLRNQVDFHVIFGDEGPVAERLEAIGVGVTVIPQMRSTISPRRDLVALRALCRIVREWQPDLIHAHSSKAGMLGRLIGLYYGVPSLYTVHGWGWRGLSWLNFQLVFLIEWLLSGIRKSSYIFVAEDVANDAYRCLGVPPAKGRVIYNGVPDVLCDGIKAERLTIIMPARVSSAKDHESLVRAFESLDLDAQLVLCGGGTADERFLDQIRTWAPIRHCDIVCLGPRSDMPLLLSSAHIFALASHFEALPLSIIEAMSAGLPVIATKVGGVAELIKHNDNGLLVAPSDVQGIATAIKQLTNEQERIKIGKLARKAYLDSFTSAAMSQSTLAYYKEIVSSSVARECPR